MPQTFGAVLKERRKIRGITIVELAERTGLSQAELVGVELGLKELRSSQRQKVEAFIRRQRII
jgi:transcriptional regulator with XRE-family HTH domain